MIWLETIKAMNINSKNKDHFLQMNAFFFLPELGFEPRALGMWKLLKLIRCVQ